MSYPLAWSWSRIKEYGQCPRKFNAKYVAKSVKEKPSDAMQWGNEVHKSLELRIRSGTPLPTGMGSLEKYARVVDNAKGKVWTESKLAVNDDLDARQYFDKDVSCRAVSDVLIVGAKSLGVIDWKTGKKIGDEDHLQLELTMVLALCKFPHAESAVGALVYTALDDRVEVVVTRDELPAIWASFQPQVKRMRKAAEDDNWPENPSGLCGWCPVKQCQHHP
jgi:CRISPR/Cas system-associated exonuclease Cas4 (RecB family)